MTDFERDYNPERINKIHGCKEISGKFVNVHGIRFLGLGFDETRHRRLLASLINEHKGKVDIAIMHGENIRAVSSIKPKLIIRGGYVAGKYLVEGIPSVWNCSGVYSLIIFKSGEISIEQYHISGRKFLHSIKKIVNMSGLNPCIKFD